MTGALADTVRSPPIWRERPFWTLFIPAIGVGLEQQILLIALPLLVYQASASALEMNLVRGLGLLPNLLLAFIIGALVDQANKRRWLLSTLAVQAGCLVALALAFGENLTHLGVVYPLVFALSTAVYAYHNVQTVAMKLALRPEQLGPATAALSSVGQAFQMLGPALAGLLLMLPSPPASLWVAAAVALVSLAAALRLTLPRQEIASGGSLRVRVVEGWRALRANRPLWLFTLVVIVTNAADGMFAISMLQQAQAAGLTGAQIGLMFSVAGGLGLLGGLLAPGLRARLTMGGVCLLGMAGSTACYAAVAFTSHPLWLTAILATEAFFTMIYNVMIWTLRQETTPAAVIGRVTGLTGSLFKLAMPLAIVGAGVLADGADLAAVFVVSAALNGAMLVAFLISLTLRSLR
ncbi:MAG TPA: MFS transporter [Microvirga sp.]|jgi:predicted MFS family arabinose efflux permease|nr:MFS transporter [Microvirga sp.]